MLVCCAAVVPVFVDALLQPAPGFVDYLYFCLAPVLVYEPDFPVSVDERRDRESERERERGRVNSENDVSAY